MAHVLLPCDMPNWPEVADLLNQARLCRDAHQLVTLMQALHDACGTSLDPDDIPKRGDEERFKALESYVDQTLSADKKKCLFETILPNIVDAALQLKSLKPSSGFLYSLPQNAGAFTLNREFVASMLAHAFFSTFPKRTAKTHPTLQDFNFGEFFRHLHRQTQQERLWLFLSYFENAISHRGNINVFRQVLPPKDSLNLPAWLCCDRPLCSAFVRPSGNVSDAESQLYRVCSCNRNVGGDVLRNGSSMESLLFCQMPELLMLLSFMEALDDNEAILVQGLQQIDSSSLLSNGKLASGVDVCLLDAHDFSDSPIQQYEDSFLLRELTKAMAGFQQPHNSRRPSPVGKSSSSSTCHESTREGQYLKECQRAAKMNSEESNEKDQLNLCSPIDDTSNNHKNHSSVSEDETSSNAGSSLEHDKIPISAGSSQEEESVTYQRLDSYDTVNEDNCQVVQPSICLRSLVGRIFTPLNSDSLTRPSNGRSCSMPDSEKGLTMLIDTNSKEKIQDSKTCLTTALSNGEDNCLGEQNGSVSSSERRIKSQNNSQSSSSLSRSLNSTDSCENGDTTKRTVFFTPPSTLPRRRRKSAPSLDRPAEEQQNGRRESCSSQSSQQRPLHLEKQLTSPSSGASSEGAALTEIRDQLAPLIPISSLLRTRPPRAQSSADEEFFTPSESFEDDGRSRGDPPSGVATRLLREAIICGIRKSSEKQSSVLGSSQEEPHSTKRWEESGDSPWDYDDNDAGQSHISRSCDSAGFVLDSDLEASSLNLSPHERYEDFRRRIQRRNRRLSKRSSRSSARQSSSGSSDMDDIIEDPEMGFSSALEPAPLRPSSSEPSLLSLSATPEPALPPISILPDVLSTNKCKKLMVTTANGQLKAYSYDGVNPNLPVPFKAKFRCRNNEDGNDQVSALSDGGWDDVYTARATAYAAAVVAASEGTSVTGDFESLNEGTSSAASEKNGSSMKASSYVSNELLPPIMKTMEGVRGVAAGRWGTDALHGDIQLKLVILWLAASMMGLPCIVFYTEGDAQLEEMPLVIRRAKIGQWSVGDLACELLRYCRNRLANYGFSCDRELPPPALFNQLLSGDASFVSNDSLD